MVGITVSRCFNTTAFRAVVIAPQFLFPLCIPFVWAASVGGGVSPGREKPNRGRIVLTELLSFTGASAAVRDSSSHGQPNRLHSWRRVLLL